MPASKDRQPQDEIDVETDFLVAARRAAQAAAQEVMEAEHRAGIGDATHGRNSLLGILGAKRRFILICLLIIAVMVAGIQAIKNGIIPGLGQRPVTATDFSFVSPESDSATTVPSNVVTSSTKSITDDRRLEFAEPTTLESPGFTASTNHLMSVPAIEPIVEQSEEFAALDAAQIPLDPLPKADQYELAPETEPAPELVALPEMEATVTAALPEADDGLIYPLPPEGIGPERLRVEAAKGNPIAMFDIASRYADGRGALQDIAAAAHWYGLAADAGLAPAQYRLGSIYENGIGLRKDIRAAEAWYRRAAVAGNINAMHNLAVLYAEGAGGNPDLSAAAGWFRRAAELGVRDSQFNLAILHARGLGVPEDYMEAYKWFAIAARFGDLQAEERRDQIASALTDSQRNAAMAEAQDFVPSASNIEANTVELPQDKWRDAKPDFAGLSENEMIRRAQTLLNTAGYDVGRPDGIYGPLTRKAIVGFQKKMGLPESGQVDKQLLAALEAHSS